MRKLLLLLLVLCTMPVFSISQYRDCNSLNYPKGRENIITDGDGKKRKTTISYYKNGGILQVAFYLLRDVDDQFGDQIREMKYHQNGQLDTDAMIIYKDDYFIRQVRTWNENGIFTSDFVSKWFKDEIPVYHGRCTFWDDEGNLEEDSEYIDGEIVKNYIKEGKTRQPLPPPMYDISLDMSVPKWIERDE